MPMLGPDWLDPEQIAATVGLIGVLVIVFAECGLLIGFFLPGDSLLFATGLLVATGIFPQPLWLVCLLITLAAFFGNLVGYWIGRRWGTPLFDRPESRLFRREYVDRTREFFERYGGLAIVLARFTPIVRTFITAMAGIAGMDFRRFAFFSAIGAVLWGTGVTVLGYFLGQIPFVANNIELILIAMVLLSVIPVGIHWMQSRRTAT
jgi:membrane-associated protein